MSVAFHLAIPVNDLEAARGFYQGVLGLSVGRESEHWIDFDFHGHQVTAHLNPDEVRGVNANAVDGHAVPVRHFGAILPWERWHELVKHLQAHDVPFLVKPHLRFEGKPGEQATLFIQDPSGNALEFKSFKDPGRLFARD